ncbi:MAG: nucleotidyltransferase domain-containing protein [Candidatus Omnitrophica bacterium]|nr:nucleotidyltransferase domain-containing protein [Candidatus Omnitrophota bacterium]
MILLDKPSLSIISDILIKYLPDEEVRVFGSRVREKCKKFSDIDIVIMNQKPLSCEKIISLSEMFSNSELLFRVDICQWNNLPDFLKKKIKAESVVIQEGRNSHK